MADADAEDQSGPPPAYSSRPSSPEPPPRFAEPHIPYMPASIASTSRDPGPSLSSQARVPKLTVQQREQAHARMPVPNTQQFVTLTLSRHSNDNFIVRDAAEQILYWVENKHEHIIRANPIRVYRPGPKGEKIFLAELEFHQLSKNLLTYQGKQSFLDSHFPHKDWPSASRLFHTPYGAWKWSDKDRCPLLWDENRILIAKYQSNQHIFRPSTRPTVEVHYKALEFIDMFLLGLLVRLEDIERRRRND